jgi:hypothetical protein
MEHLLERTMNYLDATLVFLGDAIDMALKAPELDDDGIGHSTSPGLSARQCRRRVRPRSRPPLVPLQSEYALRGDRRCNHQPNAS